jgi:hypothetical protein
MILAPDWSPALDQAMPKARQAVPYAEWIRTQRLSEDGGPHAGERYDPDTHPAQRHFHRAWVGHRWIRFVLLGPVQDGKSWLQVLVALYCLAELRCHVALALPTVELWRRMWPSKWRPPMLAAGLLPEDGAGSEGGCPITFPTVYGSRFTALGAGTKNENALAAITVRHVGLDEVDDILPSRRVDLACARATGWGLHRREVMTSTIKGDTPRHSRILREYASGTASRLHHPCPHCGHWQPYEWAQVRYDATSDLTAADTARLHCVRCDRPLTDAERRASLQRSLLVHRDQTVSDAGQVEGPEPTTATWSMRWTVLDSPLQTLAEQAVRHRQALQQRDTENDHDALRQFFRDRLATGYQGETQGDEGQASISRAQLAARSTQGWALSERVRDASGLFSRHVAPWPDGADRCVMACDVQQNRVYWLLLAGDAERRTYDLAWGYEFAEADMLPMTAAGLHAVLDRCDALAHSLADGRPVVGKGVDVGYNQADLIPWLAGHPDWSPVVGMGEDKVMHLRRVPGIVGVPGVVYLHRPEDWQLGYHQLLHVVEVDRVRASAQNAHLVKVGSPGAAHLPRGLKPSDAYLVHLCGERQEERNGRRVWKTLGGRHDWLDCRTYGHALLELHAAAVAAHADERPRALAQFF